MKVVLHPEAETEFLEAQRRYTEVSSQLGVRFYDEISQLFRRVTDHPLRLSNMTRQRDDYSRMDFRTP